MIALATAFAVVPASSAQAGYFLGQQVDGPSADIVSLGGVTLSRDGHGHVGYIKREVGAPHVFAAPLTHGNPGAPRRIDTGQGGAASAMRISSANDGRAVAVWLNGGGVYASVNPRGPADWSAPQAVYTPPLLGPAASSPSLQMGPSGAAYVAFKLAGDLRVAWLRGGSTFELNPQPLDIDRAKDVNDIDLATAADGSAIVAWAESGKVYTRRVVRSRLSIAPRQASVNSLNGVPAGTASAPSIDLEDDSTYAWVMVRQDIGGGSRVYSRRLLGSEYDPPVVVDNGIAGGESSDIDISGRGRGVAGIGVAGSGAVLGGTINRDNEWESIAPLTTQSSRRPQPAAAVSEDGRSTVAWYTTNPQGQSSVSARYFNARIFAPAANIAEPQFGPVDTNAGLDATADLFGNHGVGFVQGEGGNRRVVVSVFDKEPRALAARDRTDEWTRRRTFKLSWSDVDDPWGGVRYRVEVDGVAVTETNRTRYTLRNVRDGAHVLNIVTVDGRGQANIGRDRPLYVDRTAPTGRITSKRSRVGRPAEVFLNARDGRELLDGSGIDSGIVRWGDGSSSRLRVPNVGVIDGARLGHRYRRRGRFTVRVEMRDQAGNRRVVRGRVAVG